MLLTAGSCGPVSANNKQLHGSGPEGSAAWSLMRAVRTQLKSFRARVLCVDTDATLNGTELGLQLHYELEHGKDDEVAYRGDVRHRRKLQQSTQHTIGPVQLQIHKRGKLEYMEILPQKPSPSVLEEDMVQVQVCAVGLNFKDVLNVLLPKEAAYFGGKLPLPGLDFAGVVTALPHNICPQHNGNEIAVGDSVFGLCGEESGMLRVTHCCLLLR